MYLVVKDANDRCLARKRTKAGEPKMDDMRSLVESIANDRRVISPMEKSEPECDVVSVYTSKDVNGVGRSGSGVYLWLISRKEA